MAELRWSILAVGLIIATHPSRRTIDPYICMGPVERPHVHDGNGDRS
jgi:hypothetical protein